MSLAIIKHRNPASLLRTTVLQVGLEPFNATISTSGHKVTLSQHSNRLFCLLVLSNAPRYTNLEVVFNNKSASDLGSREIVLSFKPYKSFPLSAPQGYRRNWTQATTLSRWEVNAFCII